MNLFGIIPCTCTDHQQFMIFIAYTNNEIYSATKLFWSTAHILCRSWYEMGVYVMPTCTNLSGSVCNVRFLHLQLYNYMSYHRSVTCQWTIPPAPNSTLSSNTDWWTIPSLMAAKEGESGTAMTTCTADKCTVRKAGLYNYYVKFSAIATCSLSS